MQFNNYIYHINNYTYYINYMKLKKNMLLLGEKDLHKMLYLDSLLKVVLWLMDI